MKPSLVVAYIIATLQSGCILLVPVIWEGASSTNGLSENGRKQRMFAEDEPAGVLLLMSLVHSIVKEIHT